MLSPAREAAVPAAADLSPARSFRLSSEALALIGLTVLAGLLRFVTLSTQSYWFDEAQAAHEMQLSFSGMLNTLGAQETSPPLFFVTAWLWAKVFGTGAFGLRALSAVAGTALIPVSYLCGKELVSRRAGFVAALLAAISPFMIWYSQEAREYMLLALMSAASVLFFARSLRSPTTRNLIGWAAFSALALLTHFFAGFLVAPEAIWLVLVLRSRAAALAVCAVVVVELALAPLAISDTSHPLGWLTTFSLSTRIQQVPVSFALGTLYRSSLVNYGLLGAGVLAAVVIFMLIAGSSARELRGAGIAAALAACVLVLPLLAAALGHDFYIARALIPAWVPLAVVVGAACTPSRARAAGGALAVVVAAGLVYGQFKVTSDSQYQRPDWRGLAAALGPARVSRAVVVYEGALASDPLKLYLPGVPWSQSAQTPVKIAEVDVIASSWQSPARNLPPGVTRLSTRNVAGYLLVRFSLARPWVLSPNGIALRSGRLIAPAAAPVVLVQPRT